MLFLQTSLFGRDPFLPAAICRQFSKCTREDRLGGEAYTYFRLIEQLAAKHDAFLEPRHASYPAEKTLAVVDASANDDAVAEDSNNFTPRTRPTLAIRNVEFILDSGASCHGTGDRELLADFTPAETGRSVCVADGSLLPVRGYGCVRLQGIILPGVLYVPGLAKNIVSVSKLGDLDYSVYFSRTRCLIREACDGAVVGEGRRRVDGLFQLDYLRVPVGRARCAACTRLGSG